SAINSVTYGGDGLRTLTATGRSDHSKPPIYI
ncbi:MAG: hypothetical protein ACI8QS_002335, partial [Planctomycetota bacterium]